MFRDFSDSSGDFLDCPFPLSRPIDSTHKEQSRKGPRRNPDLFLKTICAILWQFPSVASIDINVIIVICDSARQFMTDFLSSPLPSPSGFRWVKGYISKGLNAQSRAFYREMVSSVQWSLDIRGSFAQTSRIKTSVSALETLEKLAFRRGHPWPKGAGVHDPKGCSKTSVRRTLGWISVPSKRPGKPPRQKTRIFIPIELRRKRKKRKSLQRKTKKAQGTPPKHHARKKRAQTLTFGVQRPPGGVGVFHAKGWWSKSSCSPRKCVFLAFRGTGCPGPLGVFEKFVPPKKVCAYFGRSRMATTAIQMDIWGNIFVALVLSRFCLLQWKRHFRCCI